MMAVYSHPDDAEVWSGGSIAKWNSMGGISHVVCFSNGDSIRENEAKNSASILGYNLHLISRICLVTEENIKEISEIINNLTPDILITHYYSDTHPAHRSTFEIVNSAVIKPWIKNRKPEIFLCSNTYNSLGMSEVFEPTVIVDISEFIKVKEEAISQHRSQHVEILKNMSLTQAKSLADRYNKAKYVEGFIQVPINGKLANTSLF